MLLKTDSLSGGFEQFAAIEELPTHNQQVRMLAGANVKTQQRATRSMLELAKGRLCHMSASEKVQSASGWANHQQVQKKRRASPRKRSDGNDGAGSDGVGYFGV